MPHPDEPSTLRRTFLTRMTLGAAALLATRSSLVRGETMVHPGSPDEWVSRIHGKYRQVFDSVTPNDGFGAAYALNFIDSTKQAHNLGDDAVTAVLSLRHIAITLALSDAAWQKYHLGEMVHVTDPVTRAPAMRNIFRANIMKRPGLTYEQMITTRGVVVTVCSMALHALSGIAAQRVGIDPVAAEADWKASFIPGVVLVPSGVYAVNRAQQARCTYCYAG